MMIRAAGGLLVLALVCPSIAPGAELTASADLAGDAANLWFYAQSSPDDDGQRALTLAFLPSRDRFPIFTAVPLAPSRGTLKFVTAQKGELHFFFPDGSHYMVSPPGRALFATQQTQFEIAQPRLPAGEILAVAADNRTGKLVALATADALANLAKQHQPNVSSSGVEAAEPPPPTPVADGYGLLVFDTDRWTEGAPGPWFLEKPGVCRLAAWDGHVTAFFAAGLDKPLWSTSQLDTGWSAPVSIGDLHGEDMQCISAGTNGVELVATRPASSDERRTLMVYQLGPGGWIQGSSLLVADRPLEVRRDAVAVAFWRESIAVLDQPTKEAPLRIGLWPRSGGDPLAAPTEALGLRGAADTALENRRMIVAGAVLGALTLLVLLRRRDQFLLDLPVPAGYVLARLGRRAAAFAIDALVVMLVYTPAVLVPWLLRNGVDFQQDVNAQLEALLARQPGQFFWLWIGWVGALALYGTVFETLRGATPGKMIFGLRVFDSKAQPCRFPAALLRNLTRVELYHSFDLLALSLLVGITRNRQRLGDLIANTVVVEKA